MSELNSRMREAAVQRAAKMYEVEPDTGVLLKLAEHYLGQADELLALAAQFDVSVVAVVAAIGDLKGFTISVLEQPIFLCNTKAAVAAHVLRTSKPRRDQ